MTVTDEQRAQRAEAAEQKAQLTEQAKAKLDGTWWTPTGDTGRRVLRESEIRTQVLRQGPDEVLDRQYGLGYRNSHLVLEVPEGEGYIYSIVTDTTTKKFYILVEKRYWKEATPQEVAPPELPKELQGLEGDELKAAIALYHQRVERGLASLRRHAIKKNMCDTFDSIMRHAGFEGRINRYRLTLAAEYERKFTDADGKNYISGFVRFNGDVKVVMKASARFEHDLREKPKEGTKLTALGLDKFDLERVQAAFESSGHKLTKAQLDQVTVTVAQALTSY